MTGTKVLSSNALRYFIYISDSLHGHTVPPAFTHLHTTSTFDTIWTVMTVWNSLPAHLRSTLISRRQFRDGLKSHLFADAYFCSSESMRYKSVTYLLTYLP